MINCFFISFSGISLILKLDFSHDYFISSYWKKIRRKNAVVSINGISLKNMVKFRGHEEETLYQGDLCLGEQKIGFWSEDSWGGPDNIILDPGYDLKQLNYLIAALNPDKKISSISSKHSFEIAYNLELLMADYLRLYHEHEEYLAAVNAEYSGIMIASDGFHFTSWYLPETYVKQSDEYLLEEMAEALGKAKESFFAENNYTKHTVKIYRSEEDFAIGSVISLKDIMPKKDFNKIISDFSAKISDENPDVKSKLPDEKSR